MSTWHLECSACDARQSGDALASVCPQCGQPWLVRYDSPWPSRHALGTRWDSRNSSFKPFPAAHVLHPYIDAILRVRHAHDFQPEDVDAIDG